MTSYRTNFRCPWCEVQHELTTHAFGKGLPTRGDYSLCFSCGEWAVVTGSGKNLRKPTDNELVKVVTTPEFRLAREAWIQMDLMRKLTKTAFGQYK